MGPVGGKEAIHCSEASEVQQSNGVGLGLSTIAGDKAGGQEAQKKQREKQMWYE